MELQQKEALQQLCRRLLEDFHVDGLQSQDLCLWGVDLSCISDAQHLSVSQAVVLKKFLKARSWDVHKSLSMLVSCLKWRRDFDMESLMSETFPASLAAAGQLSGCDLHGYPVTYNFFGGMDLAEMLGDPGGLGKFIRWRVKLMELAIGQCDFQAGIEHVMQVHDYEGGSLFKMDANVKQALRQIIKLFQDNYPEMLNIKLFVNVPRALEVLFSVLTALSDASTRRKMQMVSTARTRAALQQHIDPAQLLARYGGFYELTHGPVLGPHVGPVSLVCKQQLLRPGSGHVSNAYVSTGTELVWGVAASVPISIALKFIPLDDGHGARISHTSSLGASPLLSVLPSGSCHSPSTTTLTARASIGSSMYSAIPTASPACSATSSHGSSAAAGAGAGALGAGADAGNGADAASTPHLASAFGHLWHFTPSGGRNRFTSSGGAAAGGSGPSSPASSVAGRGSPRPAARLSCNGGVVLSHSGGLSIRPVHVAVRPKTAASQAGSPIDSTARPSDFGPRYGSRFSQRGCASGECLQDANSSMVQGMGVSCTGVTSMTAWSTEDHPDASSNHQDVCTQHSSPRPSSSGGGGGGNGSKQRGRVFSSDGTGGGSGGGGNLGASSLCKVMVAPPSGLSMLLSSSEGSCGRLRCEAAGQVLLEMDNYSTGLWGGKEARVHYLLMRTESTSSTQLEGAFPEANAAAAL